MMQDNLQEKNPPQEETSKSPQVVEMDTAMESLSDALRISFFVLKIVMGIFVVIFFLSGCFEVKPHQEAIVLRFGRIVGAGEGRRLKPGIHWAFPHPIDEIVLFDVQRSVEISIDTFARRGIPEPEELRGEKPASGRIQAEDGYIITGDQGVVHCRAIARYKVSDPVLHFTNAEHGKTTDTVEWLVKYIVENAILREVSGYGVMDALSDRREELQRSVKARASRDLEDLQLGVALDDVKLVDVSVPAGLSRDFTAVMSARHSAGVMINSAEQYRSVVLGSIAGNQGPELGRTWNGMMDAWKQGDEERAARFEAEFDEVFKKASGEIFIIRQEAKTYSEKIASEAKVDADKLEKLLDTFKGEPRILRLYMETQRVEALQEVLANVENKYLVKPRSDQSMTSLRLRVGADPELVRKQTILPKTQ